MTAPARRRVKALHEYDDLADFEPDLSEHRDALVAALAAAWLAAYRAAHPGASIDGTVEQQAQQFAAKRADELLPDLADTTQADIAALVAQANAGDWSLADLRTALRDAFTFSPGRALVIGATETTLALARGGRQAAEDQGHTEKHITTAGDDQVCEDCQDSEDDGWIGIDESYSGGDGPPFHPQCRCSEATRGSEADDEERAAPVSIVKEAHCPVDGCGRWVGSNIPVGSKCFCPTHKGVVIAAEAAPHLTVM